jgi:AraC-like DNA-binding protein
MGSSGAPDMIWMLRYLVKAFQPFARAGGVSLSFQSCKGQFPLEDRQEEFASSICALIYQLIAYTPAKESIAVTVTQDREGETRRLTIILKNSGIDLSSIGDVTRQCRLPVLRRNEGTGSVCEIQISSEAPESLATASPMPDLDRAKYLPHFYNEIRKRLRPHHMRADDLFASIHEKSPKDAVFLRKVNVCILRHMEEEDFDANRLSEVMNMSRTQLFRKLKSIIRQAPAAYIKTVRLLKAKELLETTDLRVGEVAYRTGFHTPSHFTRVFTLHFGVRPSIFIRKKQDATKR